MIGQIKRWLFNRAFSQDAPKIPASTIVINPMKTIGIVYPLNIDNQDLKYINKFITDIRPQKNIKELRFFDGKRDKNSNDIQDTYFTTDIGWYGIPKHQAIDEFTNEIFDLLIMIPNMYTPHYEYITRKSQAKFKVGFSSAKIGKHLNLIIESYNEDAMSQRIAKIFKAFSSLSKQ
ncbi:MAG: hypothetical protein R2774_09270 [Saprospiraceae bacterium]